jgi:hypothetical protein
MRHRTFARVGLKEPRERRPGEQSCRPRTTVADAPFLPPENKGELSAVEA